MTKKTVLTSGFALLGLVAIATFCGMLAPCEDCCHPGEERGCFYCCCAKVIGLASASKTGEQLLPLGDRIAPLPQHTVVADVVYGLDHPPRT